MIKKYLKYLPSFLRLGFYLIIAIFIYKIITDSVSAYKLHEITAVIKDRTWHLYWMNYYQTVIFTVLLLFLCLLIKELWKPPSSLIHDIKNVLPLFGIGIIVFYIFTILGILNGSLTLLTSGIGFLAIIILAIWEINALKKL